jgi:hypothetical protein
MGPLEPVLVPASTDAIELVGNIGTIPRLRIAGVRASVVDRAAAHTAFAARSLTTTNLAVGLSERPERVSSRPRFSPKSSCCRTAPPSYPAPRLAPGGAFEAFLLEVLSYAQVTVQFLGLGPQPSYSAAPDSPKRPSAARSAGFPVFHYDIANLRIVAPDRDG